MNRRGFLASAIAAALAPKELIAPIHGLTVLSEKSLEQVLNEIMLMGSSFNRISIKPTYLIIPSEFSKILRPNFEKWFDGSYETLDWSKVFHPGEYLLDDRRPG